MSTNATSGTEAAAGAESSHIFICCDRGDHLAWLEACWFADQDLEVWCEDGVNPGNPDWDECATAIQTAEHRIFLITNRFARSSDSVNKLKFALEGGGTSVAVLLERIEPSAATELVANCVVLDKVAMSFEQYRDQLGGLVGKRFTGAPQVAGQLSGSQSSGYSIGEWRVYPKLLRIECGAESKTLDRKLFDVLDLLVKRAPAVVTIDEFLNEVWAGTIVGDNSLHRAISRLRKAFRDDTKNPSYIETIAKSGYRLVSPVVIHESQPQQEVRSRPAPMAFHIQINRFEAIGSDSAEELALALTTEVQARLADSQSFSVMPRNEQMSDAQRRPKFLIVGLLQVSADVVRINLELHDVVNEQIAWHWTEDSVCPTSLSEQTQLANHLASELSNALLSAAR